MNNLSSSKQVFTNLVGLLGDFYRGLIRSRLRFSTYFGVAIFFTTVHNHVFHWEEFFFTRNKRKYKGVQEFSRNKETKEEKKHKRGGEITKLSNFVWTCYSQVCTYYGEFVDSHFASYHKKLGFCQFAPFYLWKTSFYPYLRSTPRESLYPP